MAAGSSPSKLTTVPARIWVMVRDAVALFNRIKLTSMSLMSCLSPSFLAAFVRATRLDPFGGSCDGGWDEFADVLAALAIVLSRFVTLRFVLQVE